MIKNRVLAVEEVEAKAWRRRRRSWQRKAGLGGGLAAVAKRGVRANG